MDLNRFKTSRNINRIITGIIIFLISGIIILFVRHRALIKTLPPLPSPQKSEANISIKNFHHIASENGAVQWTLDADSASLYSSENRANLDNLAVVFFGKDGRKLTIRADQGVLNSKTNDLRLTGNIRAEMSGYLLVTESLNYLHRSRMIEVNAPVDISGPLMTLAADTMTYDLNQTTIRCNGNVIGSFIEENNRVAQ